MKKLVGRATPAELIERVSEAGLRGRGGAGFPTAKKWQLAVAYPPPRVLVCNADESEPGTFKDRFLLTHRPLLVLEGMVLAGYAIGADHGVLYLRSDYTHLQPVLETCLQAMTVAGLVGDDIVGSGFAFRIDVRCGAGAYICGEESALLESLEGKRGEPRLRPPFPVEAGLSGRPTVVDNVETLAYVPRILEHGSAWFREVGTADSPGTKLFSLSGDIACPGVYELPLGVSSGTLIDGVGGGMRGHFGLALIGGAAGRVVGADAWDSPLDFQHQLGNGSVTVFHQGRDPLEIGANLLRFFSRETCGACLPCRVGVSEARAIIESAMAHGPTRGGAGVLPTAGRMPGNHLPLRPGQNRLESHGGPPQPDNATSLTQGFSNMPRNDVLTALIDDRPVEASGSRTILEAAESVGISIPTLCHDAALGVRGACRICVVEIDGQRELPPACHTLLRPGQVIHTQSPRVVTARRTLLELAIGGTKSGSGRAIPTRLDELVAEYGANPLRFSGAGSRGLSSKTIPCWCATSCVAFAAIAVGGIATPIKR